MMFHISAKSLSCPNNNFAMTNLTQPGFATYYENTLGYEGSLSRIIQNSVTNSSIPLWLETLCLFMQTRALGWGGDHLYLPTCSRNPLAKIAGCVCMTKPWWCVWTILIAIYLIDHSNGNYQPSQITWLLWQTYRRSFSLACWNFSSLSSHKVMMWQIKVILFYVAHTLWLKGWFLVWCFS